MYDVVIIGAGVSGSASARELSRYKVNACVIEKTEDVCSGTSKANSGIVHAGFDAPEGSLMAKLNVEGNLMMEELSKELDFPFKKNGSLVICLSEEDMPKLKELYDRGIRNGVKELKNTCTYSIVPDQIEAGTFMLAAVATRGDLTLKNCITKHLESVTAKIIEVGGNVEDHGDSIRVWCNKRPNKANIKTLPYPGFPTDMQSIFATVLTTAKGTSIITENIFESRFKNNSKLYLYFSHI